MKLGRLNLVNRVSVYQKIINRMEPTYPFTAKAEPDKYSSIPVQVLNLEKVLTDASTWQRAD